ncbi:MAG: tail fiber domain-containing protein [Rudaea sp.]|uniref:tail fiber domain-containing protein n=1 Tax=Rudaea sp. TaxID=2136325 RepID=UPI0039E22EDA
MSPNLTKLCAAIATTLIAGTAARGADVTVQPAAGSGFVVKDAAGANERLRVQESGAITLPGVPASAAQSTGLCISGAGLLGPCAGGGSGPAYTASTGLTLTGTTFAVAPTYRLPQTCDANQIAQWDGSGWVCASASGATLPAGTVNQTLRYDSTNTAAANNLLQAFADGGLLASGTLSTGSIPAEGTGARMMWYPAKAAFRAGFVDSTEWNDGNIGPYSIAMGRVTTASNSYSTAMGISTMASGFNSTAMGFNTKASGDSSTAMGEFTTASGQGSVAMGNNAQTHSDGAGNEADGSFVFGDGTAPVVNPYKHQFMVLADSSTTFYTGSTATADQSDWPGVHLTHGAGAWSTLSDRTAKDAFAPVDTRALLDRLVAMPMTTWHYKQQDPSIRHIGAIAQDFRAAFEVGEDERHISTVDADGVALAAIQGLNAKLEESLATLKQSNAAKDAQIDALRSELAAQQARVAALESAAGDLAALNREFAAMRTQMQALQSRERAAWPRRRHAAAFVAAAQP